MTATDDLMNFAYDLKLADLKNTTVLAAKRLILDQIGVQIACSTLPWSQDFYRFACAQSGEMSVSTVVGAQGKRLSAPWAAFVNGSYGHGFEIDDIDLDADVHPGCYVIPTAMAVGEWRGSNGSDFLAAVVAGYEVAQRLGKAMAPGALARGFHPTAITGPLACAVVAAKLLGLSKTELRHAFAIAASFAGGTMEYTNTGGTVKRMHGGKSAMSGIFACLMAKEGITGPSTIVEGRKGILYPFSDTVEIESATKDLGCRYSVEKMGLKPYACCVAIHPVLDAIDLIRKQDPFTGDEVESVWVGSNEAALTVTGIGPDIQDLLEMQFSLHYNAALRLYRGTNNFSDYTTETMRDANVSDLAHRVTLELDPEAQEMYPERFVAKVSIRLHDGRSFKERVDFAKGFPENPMSEDDIEQKYQSLATVVLPEVKAEKLLKAIKRIEQEDSLSEIVELIANN